MRLLHERPQANCVAMVDSSSVFHLKRYSLLADGQDEIDLRLCAALGEMGNIKADDRSQEVTRGAFGDVSGQVGEVRVSIQAARVQGNTLLQPRGAARDRKGRPWKLPPPLQTQLQRFDQAKQQSAVKKLRYAKMRCQPMFAAIARRISSRYAPAMETGRCSGTPGGTPPPASARRASCRGPMRRSCCMARRITVSLSKSAMRSQGSSGLACATG